MARINQRTLKKRQEAIEDNQWLSKLLFIELPIVDNINRISHIHVLEFIEQGDGTAYRMVRTPISAILAAEINSIEEGNAFSEYLPSDELDEGVAATLDGEYDGTLDESNAGATY